MDKDNVLKKLADEAAVKNIINDCEMSGFTSFKTGGKADALILPENISQLRKILRVLSQSELSFMVMGNGSNILVTDDGYSGVIVKIGDAFSEISVSGEELTAGAGVLLPAAAKAAAEAGLTGLEFASGIPGSIGGAVFMNAGAYEKEMKDIVKSVRVLSKDGAGEFTRSSEEMNFTYRSSVLKDTGDVVTGVVLKLAKGNAEEIKAKMRELTALRNEKQPVCLPSAGSFFKRPAGHFAGKLIQDAGLKGLTVGGAMVSELHAGFIVNTGNATAADIIDLMNVIKLTVYDKFGVTLEPEVRIIGEIQNKI